MHCVPFIFSEVFAPGVCLILDKEFLTKESRQFKFCFYFNIHDFIEVTCILD